MSHRYNDNILLAKAKRKAAGDHKNLRILPENAAEGLGSRGDSAAGVT